MKYKRQKKVQRILKFFKINYGHHPPFQLLIDGTFTRACLIKKVNIKEQIPHYLGEEAKIMTTRCCILELEKLVAIESGLYGALQVLKQFPLHECGHGHTDEERRPSAKCIRSMIADGNPKRYFVASQFTELREKARKVPGTPVLYLHGYTPTLEQPSEASVKSAEETVRKNIEESQDMKRLKATKTDEPETRKRKRAGNPNPLSCLKSKKKKPNNPVVVTEEAKDKPSLPAKKKNKRGKRKNKIGKDVQSKDGK